MNAPVPLLKHFMPMPGLLWGYQLATLGSPKELPLDAEVPIGSGEQTWLHFNLADIRCKGFLLSLPEFEEFGKLLNAQDLEPQFQFHGSALYGAIADLGRDIGETRDNVGLLYFVKKENVLITARRGGLYAPGALRKMLQNGRAISSTNELFVKLLDQTLEGADRLCENISKSVDQIEDRIARGSTTGARPSLGAHRRSAIALHRHVYGQKVLYQRLSRESSSGKTPDLLFSSASQLQMDCETLDREIISLLERIKSLQDEVSAALAEETNNNLRIMSILTILFIPPTFVTGLFGMNLKGMPFSESEPGFWYGAIFAASASALVAWILRRIGILRKKSD